MENLVSKRDTKNFKDFLDKGVHLVAGDGDVIDLDDKEPVRVAIAFNVTGYGPHVGAIYAMQRGHVDKASEVAFEILQEWELDKYPEQANNEHHTETFDGRSWTLTPDEFEEATEGTNVDKFIDVTFEDPDEDENEETEDEDDEGGHIDPDAYSVYDYQKGDQLPGAPTLELVQASLEAGDTGAVNASYDYDESIWDYIREEDRERAERRGEKVRTVFVQKD